MNRLKAFFLLLKDSFDGISEFVPEKKTVVVAGEGTDVDNPVKPALKAVAQAIDAILAAVDAYRGNRDECKKIETDVAQCTPLLEYRTDPGSKTAFFVVMGVVAQSGSSLTTSQSSLLSQAGDLYSQKRYQAAYRRICAAYAAL